MTTIKTADLTAAQINMLVAVAEGWVPPDAPFAWRYPDQGRSRADRPDHAQIWLNDRNMAKAQPFYGTPDYCRVDSHAGPIIDREHIATVWLCDPENDGLWCAFIPGMDGTDAYPADAAYIDVYHLDAVGAAASRVEAAMRAYVRNVYGDTIDTSDKPWLLAAAES